MQFQSDRELASYLKTCSSDYLYLVVIAVHSKVSPASWKYFRKYIDGKEALPSPESSERETLVTNLLEQIRYFGSHTVAYGLRKISPFHSEPGVSYAELLRDAEETIYAKFAPNSKPAKVNSVANRERGSNLMGWESHPCATFQAKRRASTRSLNGASPAHSRSSNWRRVAGTSLRIIGF